MRKIAIAMAKGGVGKTTTAVNLAVGLSRAGKRVLLVDCDTQSQVSLFLGKKPDMGLFEFVTGENDRGETINRKEAVFAVRKNLWILAGGIRLVELKNRLGEQPRENRHNILAKALMPRGDSLDYLIFDCAPGWDVLSVNILMAVEEVLCPVSLQAPALEGLKTFFGYLMSAQRHNKNLQLRYILPTMYDRRTQQSERIHHQLRRLFQKQICSPIPYTVRLSESAERGKAIFEYRYGCTASDGYRKLVKRIINDEKA